MTRLDVWDRAALGLVSIHMHGSIPVSFGLGLGLGLGLVECLV